ncbi:hypothetical protein GN331_05870 [Lysobacter sp. HX-5-24]|uniref:SLH domain-containing protein n=2 Tax=Noviluteimonas gilva TaxID=2682097 RepID=A0A7C9HY19_9GAMM|nr:hypothetical protein [Lysobacter gilvus]
MPELPQGGPFMADRESDMRSGILVMGVLAGLLAGCSAGGQTDLGANSRAAASSATDAKSVASTRRTQGAQIASAADTGSLFTVDRAQAQVRRGGMVYTPVALSESHALRAIAGGTLDVTAPDGERIAVKYARHVEHADGNWSWVGHPDAKTGQGGDALLTFGEKAVYGTIKRADGRELQVTTMGGRTWLVEADPIAAKNAPNPELMAADHLAMPVMAQVADAAAKAKTKASAMKTASSMKSASKLRASAAGPNTVTVDLLIGYTAGLRTQLGGASQTQTRLTNLIDVANDTFVQSQVDAQIRLVQSMEVNYPDNTANRVALMELSAVTCANSNATDRTLPSGGVTCSPAARPAALAALVNAREQVGADLVTLIRPLRMPDQQSCGVAWMLGGAQQPFNSTSDDFAFSVVSDSSGAGFPSNGSTCRNESLIHELGHNMGLQHDRTAAAGADAVLDADEFPHHAFGFGYNTATFFTVMAVRQTGQTGIRVFSTPNLSICQGQPCGIADQADNVRSLLDTLPTIAAFRAPPMNFEDVPTNYWAYDAIRRVFAAGITSGCSAAPARYCPTAVVKRDQMAIFLLRGMHGGSFQPPGVTTSSFADIPQGFWAISWVEALVNEGITSGCGVNPAQYCPAGSVTRAQMAVFLLRAKYGAAFVPPAATGRFADVPTNYWAAAWIEALADEGITGGCAASPARYCPETAVTRDQMAVFLTRTFNL